MVALCHKDRGVCGVYVCLCRWYRMSQPCSWVRFLCKAVSGATEASFLAAWVARVTIVTHRRKHVLHPDDEWSCDSCLQRAPRLATQVWATVFCCTFAPPSYFQRFRLPGVLSTRAVPHDT